MKGRTESETNLYKEEYSGSNPHIDTNVIPQMSYSTNFNVKKNKMMNKFLIYTSNLPTMPKDMNDVLAFAKATPKFYICNVELNGYLAEVNPGDRILTKKGNTLYVIRAFSDSLENLPMEDREYIEDLTRKYGLKKQNITSVAQITRFEDWCKRAKPLLNNTNNYKKVNKMENCCKGGKNSVKGMLGKLEEMFMPTRIEGVRIVMTTGDLCVETAQGFVAIDAQNRLNAYPEELTVEIPVFAINKPKDQVQPGDIIVTDRGFAKVTKVENDKINAIGYTGACRKIRTINDVLFNQSMVRVVMSLTGNLNGQINPMMLAILNKKGGKSFDSLLPFLMMNQQGSAVGMNPMMAMMLAEGGEGDSSLKDFLLMSALSGGNNPFANMFGTAPVAAQAPVAPQAPANPEKDAE